MVFLSSQAINTKLHLLQKTRLQQGFNIQQLSLLSVLCLGMKGMQKEGHDKKTTESKNYIFMRRY